MDEDIKMRPSDWTLALILVVASLLYVLAGCGRTYHVYIIAKEGSTVRQTIEVKADVPKTVDVNTDVSAPLNKAK